MLSIFRKKTLETLRGKSESENISQTDDNIMTKMKKDKHSSKNITQKTEEQATQTLLKTGDGFRFLGRFITSCSTCGTRRVALVDYIEELSKC